MARFLLLTVLVIGQIASTPAMRAASLALGNVTWLDSAGGSETPLPTANTCDPLEDPSESFDCYHAIVHCEGMAVAPVTMRVRKGFTGTRGTVLLHGGGIGKGSWGGRESSPGVYVTPTAYQAIIDLHDMGFLTVQIIWTGEQGWATGARISDSGDFTTDAMPGGLKTAACNSATLHHALYAAPEFYEPNPIDLEPTAAFCAAGTSGGANQVSYSVAHYGSHAIFDLVLASGGPPLSNLGPGCFKGKYDSGPLARSRHAGLFIGGGGIKIVDQAFGYEYGKESGPCGFYSKFDDITETVPRQVEGMVRRSGLTSQGAVYDYPDTSMVFVHGAGDVTSGVRQSDEYYDKLLVTSQGLVERVLAGNPDAAVDDADYVGHTVQSYQLGADLILQKIDQSCNP